MQDEGPTIIAVVNLYAFAVDTQRWELFDRVFTEDAHLDFGGGYGWNDRASLKRDFALAHGMFKSTQHVTTNHLVTIETDRAHCISYVTGHFLRDLPGGTAMFESGGWYDDSLVRTAEGWRIAERICRMTWHQGNPEVMPGPLPEALDSLRADAEAGSIAYLRVITGG